MTKLFLSLFTLLALPVVAQQVSVETARQTVRDFLSVQSGRAGLKSADVSSVELAYTAEKDGENHFYVFNVNRDKGGFVIVGADETAEEIIGYSEQGVFDYDKAPDNFKWWLEQYSLQISEGIRLGVKKESTAENKAARISIGPLVETMWDQDSPYNDAIPKVTIGTAQKCVTGCGATAIAQVMYYHQCPAAGKSKGNKSYTMYYEYHAGQSTYKSASDPSVLPNYTSSTVFSADFANTDYQWNYMLKEYTESSDTQAKNAVSTLMYHVGVALSMAYRPTASSSSLSDAVAALSDYFDYDKSAEHVTRSYYTNDDWENLIYSELEAQRPVVYGGSTSSGGGHIFICDGYDAEVFGRNKYHINWGWGGYCDGYYALTGSPALDPSGNGIGGAGEGSSYSDDQEAVINLRPNEGGDYVRNLCWSSNSLSASSVERGNAFCFSGDFSNRTSVDFSFTLGAKFTDKSTSKTYYVSISDLMFLESWSRYDGSVFNVSTNTIPEGEYYVKPVFKLEGGQWTEMTSVGSASLKITASTSSYLVTSAFEVGKNGYVTTDIEAFAVRFKVKNNTSSSLTKTFSGTVFVEKELGDSYTSAFQLSEKEVTIPANSEIEISLTKGNGYVWSGLVVGKEYMVKIMEGSNVIGNYIGFEVVDEIPSGIKQVTDKKDVEIIGIYTLTGQRIETPRKGINIIRRSDGSAVKILVR